jgi:hypothetical protein
VRHMDPAGEESLIKTFIGEGVEEFLH